VPIAEKMRAEFSFLFSLKMYQFHLDLIHHLIDLIHYLISLAALLLTHFHHALQSQEAISAIVIPLIRT